MAVHKRRSAGAGYSHGAEQKMSLEEEVRLLSMVDIFEPLSRKELEEVACRAPDIHLEQGEMLYATGDDGDRLFVLKKGRVQVHEVDAGGREFMPSVAEAGTVLGEAALADQHPSKVYVRALVPSVVCMLGRGDLERLVQRDSRVSTRLIRLLSERLREVKVRLAELTHKDVPARLASLILELVQNEGVVTGEGYKIPTRYTHEQLAAMLGSRRASVSRALNSLKEAGAIELRHRHILVADLEALKLMAEEG